FGVYQATDRIAILAPTETSIAKVLDKDGKTMALSGPLKDLVEKAGTSHVWFAEIAGGKNAGGRFPGFGGPVGDIASAFDGSKGYAISGDAGSDKLELNITVSCSTSETASRVAMEASKGFREMRKATRILGDSPLFGEGGDAGTLMKEFMESASADSSGELLTLSAKLSIAPLVKIFEQRG